MSRPYWAHHVGESFHAVRFVETATGDTLTAWMHSSLAYRDLWEPESLWLATGQRYRVSLNRIDRPAGPESIACDTTVVYYVGNKRIKTDCVISPDIVIAMAPVPWTAGGGPYSYWEVTSIEPLQRRRR